MANENIPLMSQRQGAPLTSVGSGNARLQSPDFTSNSGSGIDSALIGALAGAMVSDKVGGSGGTGGGTGGLPRSTSGGGSGSGGTGGGGGSGSAGGSGSYVSPTNNPWTGRTPGGLGEYIGGGGTGTAGSILYPPGTTQQQINADAGMTNGKPNAVMAGVDAKTGKIIAQPNYGSGDPTQNIGGTNLSGIGTNYQGSYGATTPTATAPKDQTAGTYFQDSFGNIYDGSGNLYAVNQAGTYYVKGGADTWISSDNGNNYSSNDLFGKSGGGYDPSTANDYYDTEDYFANPDDSIRDYYNTADYFDQGNSDLDYQNWLNGDYKNGGMATPLMANGGTVNSMATGGIPYVSPLANTIGGFPISTPTPKTVATPTPVVAPTKAVVTPTTPTPTTTPTKTTTTPTTPTTSSGSSGSSNILPVIAGAAVPSIINAITSQNSGNSDTGILKGIQDLLSGSNVKGALLGTLFAELMKGNGSSNTYKGLDMSKQGIIAPRTTNFGMGPANYVPYSDYMPTINSPLKSGADNTKLLSNLGASGYTSNIKPIGKAEGGRVPTHYTFGTQVNAEDFLADGGMPNNQNVPMVGGLSSNSNVPMLEGRKDYRNGAYVTGAGDGQSDDIPAMLADGEYVIDADVVAALGNGSNKAGAKVLDEFRQNIRDHKRSAHNGKIPPKAKSPLAYLKGAK